MSLYLSLKRKFLYHLFTTCIGKINSFIIFSIINWRDQEWKNIFFFIRYFLVWQHGLRQLLFLIDYIAMTRHKIHINAFFSFKNLFIRTGELGTNGKSILSLHTLFLIKLNQKKHDISVTPGCDLYNQAIGQAIIKSIDFLFQCMILSYGFVNKLCKISQKLSQINFINRK